MNIEKLRSKKLTFKNAFLFLKEILFQNYFNFIKMFGLWALFSFVLIFSFKYVSYYFIAFGLICAYVVFYLFYLAFISQSYATINKEKETLLTSFKHVGSGFLQRKGLDLLEFIPAAVIIFVIVFFPSNIFAIPLAFVVALATVIFVSYTILAQPAAVIKKIDLIPAVRYSIRLITGSFSFVLGLILALALICLIVYLPCVFINMSKFGHLFLLFLVAEIALMLFAIMITIIFTNLEIEWSIGFKNYNISNFKFIKEDSADHAFTDFFNKVPEVQIEEEDEQK